jgi:integrase
MPVKWISTPYKGIRYYEHEQRKHGIRKDRYYAIRYQKDKNRVEEGLGWVSDGWTLEKAVTELAKLREAAKKGEGPRTLLEKRENDNRRKASEKAEQEKKSKDAVTFNEFFDKTYFPFSKTSKKHESYRKENEHFKNWIRPVFGNKPLKEIFPFDIERLKRKMTDAKKSPRSIQYCMATVRQVFNFAHKAGLIQTESPTRSVKVPTFDNRRQRYLTVKEIGDLLEYLKEKDMTVYCMAFLSIQTGLRMGEISNLTWSDINLDQETICVRDPKGGRNRHVFMTKKIKTMFSEMPQDKHKGVIFKNRVGEKYKETPKAFYDAIRELKLNEDISDRRDRVCFHTLRHSFASHHAMAGTDLYVLKELLGHSVFAMTERYSHLSPGVLKEATRNLEKALAKQTKTGTVMELDRG